MRVMLAISCLLCFTQPAHADQINALTMRAWCRGVENARYVNGGLVFDEAAYPDAGTCYGAFLAMQSELNMRDANDMKRSSYFAYVCPSDSVDVDQAVRVFTKYVDEHP